MDIFGKLRAMPPPKRYWQAKIERNIKRDRRVTKSLTTDGWIVLRFWEHDVFGKTDKVVEGITSALRDRTIKRRRTD